MLAGILAAQPLTGKSLADHTIMIAGDGAAGTALAELLAEAIARQNMRSAPSLPAAVSCCRKRSSLDSWAHLKGRGEGLLGAGVSNLRQFECR